MLERCRCFVRVSRMMPAIATSRTRWSGSTIAKTARSGFARCASTAASSRKAQSSGDAPNAIGSAERASRRSAWRRGASSFVNRLGWCMWVSIRAVSYARNFGETERCSPCGGLCEVNHRSPETNHTERQGETNSSIWRCRFPGRAALARTRDNERQALVHRPRSVSPLLSRKNERRLGPRTEAFSLHLTGSRLWRLP